MDPILNIALDNISSEWLEIIAGRPHIRSHLIDIYSQINIELAIPAPNKWFEWARQTPLNSIKVIIIGQDPYPTREATHGLAFSSMSNKRPTSLCNIFKCLEKSGEINDWRATTPNLSSWAQQGVLLLNTAFTMEAGSPNAHLKLWEVYVRHIFTKILRHSGHLIIMTWGKVAQTFVNSIFVNEPFKNNTNFHRLEWCDPSSLTETKFIKCDHFTRANTILQTWGQTEINWGSIARKVVTVAVNQTSTCTSMRPSQRQLIFTDGSATSTGNKMGGNKKDKNAIGGYAALFVSGPVNKKVLLGNLDTSKIFASNIRAEGMAIISAFDHCIKVEEPMSIELYTDSEFWIKMIKNYMPAWETRNTDFKKKANPDMTIYLWQLWKKINKQHIVELIHIYSHNKSGWKYSKISHERFCYEKNNQVDHYADIARVDLKPGEQVWRDCP